MDNKITNGFNELYQILRNEKKSDNKLLSINELSALKDTDIKEDVCNPKEL